MEPTPINPSMGIMGAVMALFWLGVIACWIMVVVKAFKLGEGPLMGILALVLCTLGGLVVGWINVKKWQIKGLMLTYTILFVIAMVLYVVVVVMAVGQGAALQQYQ